MENNERDALQEELARVEASIEVCTANALAADGSAKAARAKRKDLQTRQSSLKRQLKEE